MESTSIDEISNRSLNALYEETIEFEQKIGLIIPTIFAFVILIGLVGNFLVVVIVLLNKQMRNSTNTLIIGLAISDLLFLVLCVPFTATDYVLPYWAFPHWWCGLMNYLQHVSAYASVWTLTLMALDRFLAVVFPIQSMTLRSTKHATLALALLYIVISLSQTPVGLAHDIYSYQFIREQRSTCVLVAIATRNATELQARAYYMAFNLFGYVIPLSTTCVLYSFMLHKLWNRSKPSGYTSPHVKCRPETIQAKRKATRMVMGVVIAFAICWLPLNVCFFLSGINYPDRMIALNGRTLAIVQIFSQVLAYTNSCLNPILYAFLSNNFRKGFVRIFVQAAKVCVCDHFCVQRIESYQISSKNRVDFHNGVHVRMRTTGHVTTIGENGNDGKKTTGNRTMPSSMVNHSTRMREMQTDDSHFLQYSEQNKEREENEQIYGNVRIERNRTNVFVDQFQHHK